MEYSQEIPLLRQIYDRNSTKNIIQMERFYAVLYDESDLLMTYPIVIEQGRVLSSEELPPQRKYRGMTCLPDWVVAHRRMLVISNLPDYLAQRGSPTYGDFKHQPFSLLAVPMIAGGDLLGVIVVENLSSFHVFSESETRLLSTMANQVAVAIENARAYKRLQDLNVQIARAQEILTRISISQDFVHRINNLAGTIPIWIDLVRENLYDSDPRDERLSEYLDHIEKDIEGLLSRAAELQRPIQEEDVVLETLLSSMLESVHIQYPEITINQDISLGTLCTRANYFQISSAIWNLVANAVESMAGIGTLKVGARVAEFAGEKDKALILIEDSGTGIPPERIPNLFELFHTTKGPGRGYGLWRSKNYVEEIGGAIQIASQTGVGTLVTISLPLLQKI